jgi:NAD(P)-dependent dehydrogenase (short-subunit alcohol dehydrogenase family)
MHNDKVILITGGRAGLGHSLARLLVSRGHIVYCTSREIIEDKSDKVKRLRLDVTSDSDCLRIVKTIRSREARLDVIINYAGLTLTGPTLSFTEDDFKRILDVNVIGPFRLVKAACSTWPQVTRVINITSLSGFVATPNFGLYCASKFAMEGLGLALHYELAATTEVVNVALGAVVGKKSTQMSHRPARDRVLLLKWLMPLTTERAASETICRLVEARTVPQRVLIGRDTRILHFLHKVVPLFVIRKLILYVWRKS